MAFSRSWNEGTPLGSASAATLDTIIQNLKTDIRERLVGVIPGFSNDAEDPKKLVLAFGPFAQRPAISEVFSGYVYITSDVGQQFIYVCDGANWIQLTFGELEESTGGGSGGSGGSGSSEEFTSVTINGSVVMGTTLGGSYSGFADTTISGIQGGKYPFLTYIKFRNASGPGAWSNVYYGFGIGYIPGLGGHEAHLIPSTTAAIYAGTSYYVDSVTGKIMMNPKVIQANTTGATLTFSAVVCFKTVPTPSYSLLAS